MRRVANHQTRLPKATHSCKSNNYLRWSGLQKRHKRDPKKHLTEETYRRGNILGQAVPSPSLPQQPRSPRSIVPPPAPISPPAALRMRPTLRLARILRVRARMYPDCAGPTRAGREALICARVLCPARPLRRSATHNMAEELCRLATRSRQAQAAAKVTLPFLRQRAEGRWQQP